MKRAMIFLVAAGMSLVLAIGNTLAEDQLGIKADVLNSLKIEGPERPGDNAYLGLTGTGRFTVSQVKADVLIVQVFSMYCPFCQADVPNLQNLYALIDKDPKLKDRVKLLGLGLNNSWYEVDFFKDKYKIPFPMVPDDKGVLQKAATETVRTPAYMVLKLTHGKPATVVYTKLRAIKDVEGFLKIVRGAAGPN